MGALAERALTAGIRAAIARTEPAPPLIIAESTPGTRLPQVALPDPWPRCMITIRDPIPDTDKRAAP